MKWLDRLTENSSRRMAQVSGRRSMLAKVGTLLVGAGSLPLLPVARAESPSAQPAAPVESGDPYSCDYWRYCATDGFLCSCCGGTVTSCPPGTEMSPITWVGTCTNPVDNKNYIISYNDCCGKSACGNCMCSRNDSDRPLYFQAKSNDINWCLGTKSAVYHCTVSIVLGLEVRKDG